MDPAIKEAMHLIDSMSGFFENTLYVYVKSKKIVVEK